MRVMFPVNMARNTKEMATAHQLNYVAATIEVASIKELRHLWRQFKAPEYVWYIAAIAGQNLATAANRAYLRATAFFWSAGMRPSANELTDDTMSLLEKMAFLLTAHRGLLQQPPKDASDMYRRWEIAHYVEEQEILKASTFLEEGVKLLQRLDAIVQECVNHISYRDAQQLADHLEQFCLLPQDIDISQEQLDLWLHNGLVEQALRHLRYCLPHQKESKTQRPSVRSVYGTIYSVLCILAQGVMLDEIGLTPGDLIGIKARLEAWLPQALANPDEHLVTPGGITSFRTQVMPMFDQVLRQQAPNLFD